MPVRFGATYFPCWSGQARSNAQWYCNNQMSVAQHQTRAPWFSQQLSAQTLYINKTQAQMDQDCIYAANGGIKYWAFNWARSAGGGSNSMDTEFALYQASPNKNLVNWCISYLTMSVFVGYVNTDLMTLINLLKQPNYELGPGGRPLIYFNNGSTTGVAAAITVFRTACSTNGVGNPYFVVMDFDPVAAATAVTAIGADAITTYARAFGGGGSRVPFSTFIADQSNQWVAFKNAGKDVVPCVTSGWNTIPIRSRGDPGDSYGRGGIEANGYDYVTPATTAELVTLATNAKAFIAANPSACPANTALWYAWNEHSEGGYLCPLWSATGPNTSRLDALVSVHNS